MNTDYLHELAQQMKKEGIHPIDGYMAAREELKRKEKDR